MKKVVLLFVIGLAIIGCSAGKPKGDQNLLVLSGKVEALGVSTFQYGSHILKTTDKTYALKSSKVDLKAYEGKDVILKGSKVAGYPIEGGPDFIDVEEISNK